MSGKSNGAILTASVKPLAITAEQNQLGLTIPSVSKARSSKQRLEMDKHYK